VAGLPVSYFLDDGRLPGDKRKRAGKANTNLAISIAGMTADELQAAAMPLLRHAVVVLDSRRRRTVPKPDTGRIPKLEAPPPADRARIIEMPEDTERTEALRDPRSGFIAYVPTGSLARGQALARGGDGKTVACATCHGPELKGLGPVPPIAGRSPSYTARQLIDMQRKARTGEWTADDAGRPS
jgi:cytochrome c553